MINWKVRFKNRWFWITIVPMLFLLVQQVLAIFGVQIDTTDIQAQVIAVINTVFAILAVLGIAVDLTTEGLGDSERALSYIEPYKKEN